MECGLERRRLSTASTVDKQHEDTLRLLLLFQVLVLIVLMGCFIRSVATPLTHLYILTSKY
jgi:hypothetical protein